LSQNRIFCHFYINIFMKKTVILIISISFLYGCVLQKNSKSEQGIIGAVRWVEGNLMPMIGDTTLNTRSMGIPIEREIYLFKAVKRNEAISAGSTFYKQVNGELVYRTRSKKDGSFKMEVPPGKYSIFVMEKEGYFANIFDGDNYINPVTVQINNFTDIQILVNYKAYY